MPYINVGEENSAPISLYYEDHGTGDPVVLIHGWPLSSKSWEKQVPALLDAGYRVITYDRRGFGESAKPAIGYNYDTLASDLDTILNTLNITNVTLVGFSMGGGEVARYLGRHNTNGRVTRAAFLAAITPALLKTSNNPDGVELATFEDIQREIAKDRPAFLRTFFKKFYNAGLLSTVNISEEMLNLSWNIAVMASPIGTYQCVRAWLEDFRDDIARIRTSDIPTLVLHGDADNILPIKNTGDRTAGAFSLGQYIVVEGAPHGCTWTHAPVVNGALIDFLQARPTRPQRT
jgi:non-heme chloroperoxidase